MDDTELKQVANRVRQDILTEVFDAQSGHPGGALSSTEILTYLYFQEMHVDPKNPRDPDRDRFVLSKGHSSPGLYAVLAEKGFFDRKDLSSFRKAGSFLQGHPNMNTVPGVDMSTGSLGQGISAAVGMALGAKLKSKTFRVYTLLGDGELEEGEVWEAAMFAGNHGLDNLTVIVDNNNLQIDGPITEVNSPYPIGKKFEDFHFHVIEVEDGNDFAQLRKAFEEARETKGAPSLLLCHTVKGKGVSYMENAVGWHGKAPNEAQYEEAMEELKEERA